MQSTHEPMDQKENNQDSRKDSRKDKTEID